MYVPQSSLSRSDVNGARYSEAIPLLYSTTHFHFPDPTNLPSFRTIILLQRLNSIRFLSIDWSDTGFGRSHSRGQWESTFDVVSQMKELQELRICAKMLVIDPEHRQMKMMQPLLRRVEGLRVYELVVPGDQLRLWEGFITGDMQVRLVGLPKRVLRNVFDGRDEDIIA
jgi:hypothetical protein